MTGNGLIEQGDQTECSKTNLMKMLNKQLKEKSLRNTLNIFQLNLNNYHNYNQKGVLKAKLLM